MKNITKNLFFLIFFVAPLIYVTNTRELFEFPKMYFIYAAAIIIFAFFLTDIILRPRRVVFPPKIIFVFLIIYFISTILSSHSYTSIFGYYTRFNGGLLSVMSFFSLYFVGINTFSKEDLSTILKILQLTIIPIGVVGVFQYCSGVERVYSTFGQPNWLGQYLAILLPSVLYFSLKGNFNFWFLVYILGFACLWFTFSLSSIVGFLIAFLMIVYLIKRKIRSDKDTRNRLIFIFIVSIVIAAGNFQMFGNKFQDFIIDFKKFYQDKSRVYALDVQNTVSDPGFIRLGLWKGTWNLIRSSSKIFLIGSGPGTFAYVFQNYRDFSSNYSSEWDFVLNKPHNYYLELWAELGVFMLATYLVIVLKLIKNLPKYMVSGVITFLLTNIFSWPTVATTLIFWFWLLSYSKKLE